MERSGLRSAPPPERQPPAQASRAALVALALVPLSAALAATWLGADAARRPSTIADRATAIVNAALESDPSHEPSVLPLREMRADLGRRPLDATTRVLYAGLLLDRAADARDRSIATFQADRAARLAPVTVPVVRAAVVVLARAGAAQDALDRVRAMFDYDAGAAAELLASIEPFLPEGSLDRGVADAPAAWLAWALRLAQSERRAESDAWLDRGLDRWPGNPGLLEEAAGRAASRRDWTALDRLLPAAASSTLSPRLLALRGWGCAARGDRQAARADVTEALRRGTHDANLLSVAGEALAEAGDLDGAAARWREGLFRLPRTQGPHGMRTSFLTRLARLEDRRSRPGDALRAWRAVLAADPANEEARRRIVLLGSSIP